MTIWILVLGTNLFSALVFYILGFNKGVQPAIDCGLQPFILAHKAGAMRSIDIAADIREDYLPRHEKMIRRYQPKHGKMVPYE